MAMFNTDSMMKPTRYRRTVKMSKYQYEPAGKHTETTVKDVVFNYVFFF